MNNASLVLTSKKCDKSNIVRNVSFSNSETQTAAMRKSHCADFFFKFRQSVHCF